MKKFLIKGIRRNTLRSEVVEAVENTFNTKEFLLNYKDNRAAAVLFVDPVGAPETILLKNRALKIREQRMGEAGSIADVVTPLHAVPYDAQLEQKKRELAEFVRDLVSEAPERELAVELAASPITMGYRNKCEFTFGYESGHVPAVGFRGGKYALNPNAVLDPSTCVYNVSEKMLLVVKRINEQLRSTRGVVYDRVKKQGYLKIIMLREMGGQTVSLVQVHGRPLSEEEMGSLGDPGWKEALALLTSIPTDHTYVQFSPASFEGFKSPEGIVKLRGRGSDFFMDLHGASLRVSLLSFFQVNLSSAALLVGHLAQKISNRVLLDLCCGSGPIGVCLGQSVAEVVGIEIDPSSVEDARYNAARNNVRGTYHCGSVEAVLPGLVLSGTATAVLDPPRSGVSNRLIRFIKKEKRISELFYVSCSYRSVAGNLKELLAPSAAGAGHEDSFVLEGVWAVDMFPHTREVECVFQLGRQRKN